MTVDPIYAYRAAAVTSADSVQLVIMLHDMLIADLQRCAAAARANDVEARTNSAAHALDVLHQLQRGVDLEGGGDAARNMDRLYSIARVQLLNAQAQAKAEGFERQVAMFTSLRDAWKQAQAQAAHTASQPPAVGTAVTEPGGSWTV